jgi:hypothetical protein
MSTLTTVASEVVEDDDGIDPESKAELAAMEQSGEVFDAASYRLNKALKTRSVICLLKKGFTVRDVCKIARVSATLVCGVLRNPKYAPSIAEARSHVTTLTKVALRVGLEAKLASWTAPDAKPPDVFDLKMLRDMAALDEGGVTVRIEHTYNPQVDEIEASLMRMVDGTTREVSRPALSNVQDAVVMGLESQKVHALPASTDPDPTVQPNIGVIGECEETQANNEPKV